MPSILQYLYDLTGKTLHFIGNRERCERKTAVAIYWLGLCNISKSLYVLSVSILNSVSGEHKPHTLPLISLSPCGDIWLTVWISVLEFCSYSVRISEETVLQASASDRYLPMRSGLNDTRYLMFTLRRGHQIFSPAGQI
jgi:hypothetical protein